MTDPTPPDSPARHSNQPPDAARSLSVRTQLAIVGALAVLGLIGLAGYGISTRGADRPPTDAAANPAAGAQAPFKPTREQLASLKIATVQLRPFASVQSTDGRIALNGDTLTPVYSPYSGRVTRVAAGPGDQVNAGAALLTLEASEFIQAQNDLAAALVGLNSVQAMLAQARINETRKHALFDAHGGALQDWQQSQTDLVNAESNARAAEAALALVRNRLRILGESPEQIAALEHAGRIEPTVTVRAPIRGTVIDRQVGVGQFIQAGSTNPVFTIGDLSSVWLIANVRQQDAAAVRRGQPVEVDVAALPGRRFAARITQIAPSVDPNTHRLAVRAQIDNPDGALKPEMFATFRIVTSSATAAPAVADSAVIYEGDSARVWVVNDDGTMAPRTIVTGRSDGDLVEVVSGLQAGQKVVVGGSLFIDRAGGAE